MLLCCSLASAPFISRNPSSLSVDRLNSKIYPIFRASLIATPSSRLPQKQFTTKDPGSRLYCVSWLFLTGIFTSISCAFSASSSLLQILRNSSRRHSVLMLLSSSTVTNLSLLCGFCAARMLPYRCLQMDWWAAVTIVAIPSQSALLMWQCVLSARPSVLSPRASRTILHSRHPADCILPISVRKLAVVVFPATVIPNCLLRRHGIFWSLRYFLSISLPASCLSMKSATHVLSVGWWMSLLFFFCLIQVFLKPSSSIHVPCCRAVTILGS